MYNSSMLEIPYATLSSTYFEIGSHSLLAQVPLTVSPFISLPTATTLPYTYKPLPSTLPPSSTADSNGAESEKYVVSRSGHAASPEEIIASCKALQDHILKVEEDAQQKIKNWEKTLKDQELAEKRRVAPGWLDRDEKILEPNKSSMVGISAPEGDQKQGGNIMDQYDQHEAQEHNEASTIPDAAGDEIDRAFGGIGLSNQ